MKSNELNLQSGGKKSRKMKSKHLRKTNKKYGKKTMNKMRKKMMKKTKTHKRLKNKTRKRGGGSWMDNTARTMFGITLHEANTANQKKEEELRRPNTKEAAELRAKDKEAEAATNAARVEGEEAAAANKNKAANANANNNKAANANKNKAANANKNKAANANKKKSTLKRHFNKPLKYLEKIKNKISRTKKNRPSITPPLPALAAEAAEVPNENENSDDWKDENKWSMLINDATSLTEKLIAKVEEEVEREEDGDDPIETACGELEVEDEERPCSPKVPVRISTPRRTPNKRGNVVGKTRNVEGKEVLKVQVGSNITKLPRSFLKPITPLHPSRLFTDPVWEDLKSMWLNTPYTRLQTDRIKDVINKLQIRYSDRDLDILAKYIVLVVKYIVDGEYYKKNKNNLGKMIENKLSIKPPLKIDMDNDELKYEFNYTEMGKIAKDQPRNNINKMVRKIMLEKRDAEIERLNNEMKQTSQPPQPPQPPQSSNPFSFFS